MKEVNYMEKMGISLVPSDRFELPLADKLESIREETMEFLLEKIDKIEEFSILTHPREAKIAAFHSVLRMLYKSTRKNYYHFLKNEGYE